MTGRHQASPPDGARPATSGHSHADLRLTRATDLATARAAVVAASVDPAAEAHRKTVLDFVDSHPDALHRSCLAGHLTGSALVVDATGSAVVMLHHRKLRLWVQPGGHADGEANLAAAALDEATEETGISGLRVVTPAIDIDVHEVRPPGEQPHLHLDVRYLVLAPEAAEVVGNHESTDIRWCTLDDLVALGVDSGVMRLARHGLAQFGARDAGCP